MGLTAEVRNFFTNRINRVLNEKIQAIRSVVDNERIGRECADLLVTEHDGKDILARLEAWEAKNKRLEQEEKILSRELATLLTKVTDGSYYCYRESHLSDLMNVARSKYQKRVENMLYPDVEAQVKKIEHIKEDVHSVVLLATTEPKLVASLTKVLQNYGGDISELLELIPQE